MNLVDHLDKLRAFKVIIDAGSMREATRKLNLTQPSLTRLVQCLEQATGAQLLSRGRHGVAPTEAGKLLLGYTNSILKELDDLQEKIKTPSDRLSGHLRVGAYTSLADYLWPDFMPSFKKIAPNLKLSIRTSDNNSDQLALEKGQIDILVDAETRMPGNFMSWHLYEDKFNFYMKKGESTGFDPETIKYCPLIYSPIAFDQDNKKIMPHLQEKGYSFNETIELDSFTTVATFAKKGLGISVLPMRLAEVHVKAGQLRQVSLKNFSQKGFGVHTFAASILESRRDDPRLRILIKNLRDWFKAA